MATLFVGLLLTAGFATLAIGQLNIISVAFAVLFIGLSVDFGIHYALRYQEGLSAAHGLRSSLGRAAVGVGGALTLSAVTAAIGFFSFLPTAYRGLAELGLISGVGMFIALFANLTVLPAVLALMPLKPGSASGRIRATGARLQRAIEGHSRSVLIVAFVHEIGPVSQVELLIRYRAATHLRQSVVDGIPPPLSEDFSFGFVGEPVNSENNLGHASSLQFVVRRISSEVR